MRVLFVSSGNSITGVSPIIKSQGESLKRSKVEIDYFLIKGKGIKGYYQSIKEVRKHIKHKEYDIIHAHYGLSAIVAIISKRNEKIIVSFMGDDLVGSHNFDGDITNVSKVMVFINKIFAKYFFDFNIVKSNEMLRILNVSNSKVISNGVDFDRFFEMDKKEIENSLIQKTNGIKQVLFCSNPNRSEKNYSLAKEAVKHLTKKNIELKYIHGIDQENLVNYYNSADCLLLTSFHEGSPNVIKEAMACNIPIVSTNVGDVKEVIGNTNGCFITTFDPEDVANNIEKALNYGKRTTGREDIWYLESSVVAKKIIELYKDILEK